MEDISNKFAGKQGALAIITLLFIFAQFFSSINPQPSFPSIAKDARKQFQSLNIIIATEQERQLMMVHAN